MTKAPILLVEDDSIDAMMVNRALCELDVTNKLIHCENGEEALNFLEDQHKSKPCIILLDLNMPRMGGIEFLEVIQNKKHLSTIPIVLLSTSSDHKDLLESFSQNVVEYIVKPIDYQQFVRMIKSISNYWSQQTPTN